MKRLILLMVATASFSGVMAQSRNANNGGFGYFAQGYFELAPGQDLAGLESELAQNANVDAFRFDSEQGVYTIITKDITSFDRDTLVSWLGSHVAAIHCTQIGIHGVDQRQGIPFENCVD